VLVQGLHRKAVAVAPSDSGLEGGCSRVDLISKELMVSNEPAAYLLEENKQESP
jgi:hypothetical protein